MKRNYDFFLSTLLKLLIAAMMVPITAMSVDALSPAVLPVFILVMSVIPFSILLDFGLAASLRNIYTGSQHVIDSGYTFALVIFIFVVFFFLWPIEYLRNYFEIGPRANFYSFIFSICLSVFVNVQNSISTFKGKGYFHSLHTVFSYFFILFTFFISDSSVRDLQSTIDTVAVSLFCGFILSSMIVLYSTGDFPRRFVLSKDLKDSMLAFGVHVFSLQLLSIVLFSSHRLLLFGFGTANDLVVFDIGFKIFSVFLLAQTAYNNILWSKLVAPDNLNYPSRRRILISACYFMLVSCFLIILTTFCAKSLLALWLGNTSYFVSSTYVLFAIWFIGMLWANFISTILNSLNMARAQLRVGLFCAFVYIIVLFFSLVLNFFSINILIGISFFNALFPLIYFRKIIFSVFFGQYNLEKVGDR